MTARKNARARPSRAALTRQLIGIGRRFYGRNWVLGTSGNFSAVVSRTPLRLLLTASAVHKGTLAAREFVVVDERGRATGRSTARPSAETALHLAIVRARSAAAVLHTHSVWGTILSEHHAHAEGLAVRGYEMLKGLHEVTTHEHREWIPIVENDQDMTRLAGVVGEKLRQHPQAHAFLIRGHGLYTWGASVADAERHVEILEFLFEAVARGSQHGHSQNP
jgi:methylthioribulose-1-phosphate dehydratase